MSLSWYGPEILRIRIWPGQDAPRKDSLCVVAEPECGEWKVSESSNGFVLSSACLEARVRANGEITFTRHGRTLLTAGDTTFPANDLPNPEDRVGAEQIFALKDDDALYGLGQFEDGVMNWRGHQATLIHANRVVAVPFLCSTGNWGMLWDNPSHTEFEDGSEGMRFWSEVGDGVDYYLCTGESMGDVIRGYRRLTGDAPLFPRAFYGYIQCKCRYMSATELEEVVAEYRKRKLPLDVIVQDWLYWGGWKELERWSAMVHDPVSYGDLPGAIRAIHDMHAQVMVSIWPCLGMETAVGRELREKGFIFEESSTNSRKLYDAFSPEARGIYWRHAREGLFNHGVDAWWMDATEPVFWDCHTTAKQKEVQLSQRDTAAGSWARVLSGYSLAATTGVYEGQRDATGDKRVFILSRSAWAGQQRNGAATWSGDTIATWEVFQNQIPAGLNFCMAGIPYWTTDNGGFFMGGKGSSFPDGVKDPAFREFYLRWFQYSCFCPLMRSHGTDAPREIWQFGSPGECVYDSLAAFDHLRMRLLPYSYSLAADACFRGGTPMYPLAMRHADDPLTYGIKDQFYYGPSLMACPVTVPMVNMPAEQCEVLRIPGDSGGDAVIRHYDGLESSDPVFEYSYQGEMDFHWGGNLPDGVSSDEYRIEVSFDLIHDSSRPERNALMVQFAGRCMVDIQGERVVDDWTEEPRRCHTIPLKQYGDGQITVKVIYGHTGGSPTLKAGWYSSETKKAGRTSVPMTREVYLPQGRWYNFWTGEQVKGGGFVTCEAPLEIMPVMVPAGALLPLGPVQQWHDQLPPDRLELRIYRGADGRFTLYQDAGNGYAYERGERSEFELLWEDAASRLTVGERKGFFPGMPQNIMIDVVLVEEGYGTGPGETATPNTTLSYTGKKVSTKRISHTVPC